MKKIIISILLLISLCISLFGCRNIIKNTEFSDSDTSEFASASESLSDTKTTEPVKDYSIVKHNGKTYIVFDDPTIYNEEDYTIAFKFHSEKEFCDMLNNNWAKELASFQKTGIVKCYSRDDYGIILYNKDCLYVPQSKEIIFDSAKEIELSYICYYAYYPCVDSTGTKVAECNFFLYQSQEHYSSEYAYFLRRGNNSITKTEILGGQEIPVTYHLYGLEGSQDGMPIASITYTMQKDNKTFNIIETYDASQSLSEEYIQPQYNENSSVLDITPLSTHVFVVEDNDLYYSFFYLDAQPTKLTPEQILSLGIEKYSPQ